MPLSELVQARQGGERAIRRLLEQRFDRALGWCGALRQVLVNGQAGRGVLVQPPLPAHQGVGGAGDGLPQRRLTHQTIQLVDEFIGVVEQQRRTRAGKMAVGIEVLQHRRDRSAGVLKEFHIGAAAVELGGQQRCQTDVEPLQPSQIMV